ncbi:hypothetical protein Tco_0723666 [Tanacetum coccineum]
MRILPPILVPILRKDHTYGLSHSYPPHRASLPVWHEDGSYVRVPVPKGFRSLLREFLVEDDEEDEEIEESLDSDSVSEDVEDEGPTTEDEDPAAGDEGLAAGDKSPGMEVESRSSDDESRGIDDKGHSVESDGLSLEEEEEAVLKGQQRAVPVVGTAVYSTFEVGQGSGSAPDSERPERVSESRQLTLTMWTDPEDSMVYIDVPAYPPPVAPVQTPPSPE